MKKGLMRTFTSKEEFLKVQYEGFKLQWMMDHGYILQDLIDQLDCSEGLDTERALGFLYDEWEKDVGFGGEIWPCYGEWLQNEGAEDAQDDFTRRDLYFL